MKIISILAVLGVASGIRHRGDPEDKWIEIPKFKISVNDPHEQWGHET